MKPHVPGRLRAQRLVGATPADAADVVRYLGAVQCQLPELALWGVARRAPGLTLEACRDACARGDVLRTHVLRPTWHYVDPADVHAWLRLTGPRVRRLMAPGGGQRVGDAALERGAGLILEALRPGTPLTRAELADRLRAGGLDQHAPALAHAVMHAEIEGLVVSGAPRGAQHTYVLLDTVVPPPPAQPYDELLAWGARRYARGHGPFRDTDLAWWTSLTLTQSRRAIALADLRPLDVDGARHWTVDDAGPADDPPAVLLLPSFDEYISYARDADDFAAFDGSIEDLLRGSGLLVLDGLLAGSWSRTVGAHHVDVRVRPSAPLGASARRALADEVAAFGHFLGREPRLHVGD
jgi:hypothetical protein